MSNKELIMKDFLKLKEEGVITVNFNNINELCDVLTQLFIGAHKFTNDFQLAYHFVNLLTKGLLQKHYGLYCIGTEEDSWRVVCNLVIDKYDDTINKWNTYYKTDLKSLSEIANVIDDKLIQIMSDNGCDVINALTLLLYNTNIDSDVFVLKYGEKKPRILFDEYYLNY